MELKNTHANSEVAAKMLCKFSCCKSTNLSLANNIPYVVFEIAPTHAVKFVPMLDVIILIIVLYEKLFNYLILFILVVSWFFGLIFGIFAEFYQYLGCKIVLDVFLGRSSPNVNMH